MLDSMHLSGTVPFRAEFREPWSVTTPDSCHLAQALPFHTEHIIPFHVIASGRCRIEITDRELIWLNEGDAVLLPHGDSHRLGGRQIVETLPIAQLRPAAPFATLQSSNMVARGMPPA
jgi:AraC family transcriptional regulator, alkane utilization regulator